MSPDMKRDFEHEWAELSPRLHALVSRKKVSDSRRDDVVQEVALRLLLMWPQVDRARPLWPLALTIAMNLVRDESRIRPVHEVYGDVPDVLGISDVEASGLARLELDRVRKAMAALTAPQRRSLLKEIGAETGNGRSLDAEKMLRLRARRKLSEVLRDVSGVVFVRYRRILDAVQGLLPVRDSLAQSSVCLLCVLAGITGGVVVETAPRAEAAPLGTWERLDVASVSGSASRVSSPSITSHEARPEAYTSSMSAAAEERKRSKKNSAATTGDTAGAVAPPGSLLPGGGDSPVPVPGGAPPVPGGEAPDTSVDAPAPEEPPAPPPPPVDATAEVIATVEETASSLLDK